MRPLQFLPLLLLATPLSAQTPAGGAPFTLPVQPIRSVLHDVADDGTLWTLGTAYKASFSKVEARFIPFLGSDAPRNYPVSFRVSGARVGGVPLDVAPAGPATRGEGRITVPRRELVEEYLVELESIEQTFRFDRLPARGELAVSVRVETDLTVDFGKDGVRFTGPYGGVHMGAAFAVDARGRRTPIETRPTEQGYALVVPAAFVEDATLPLWIDPLIGPLDVPQQSTDGFDPDVTWFGAENTYNVAYMSRFSSTDHDVFVLRFSGMGTYIGGTQIDFSTDDWREPKIATHSGQETYTVVASVGTGTGPRTIQCRTYASGNVGPRRTLSASPPTADCVSPDISGVDAPAGNYVVVWEREDFPGARHTIHSTAVSFSGIPLFSPTQLLSATVTVYSRPRLSTSAGQNTGIDVPRVVLTAQRAQGNALTCSSRLLNGFTGLPEAAEVSLPTVAGTQVTPVASSLLDGDGERLHLVAMTVNFSTDSDIYLLLYRGTTQVDGMNLSAAEGNFLMNQTAPVVCTDGNRFIVGYVDEMPGGELRPHFAVVNAVGEELVLVEGRSPATSSPGIQATPSICARGAAGGQPALAAMVWTLFDGSAETEGALIRMQDALDLGFGTACAAEENSSGTPAWIALSGSGIAGDVHEATVMGLPANQFGFILNSQSPGNLLFPGGSDGRLCLSGAIGRMNGTITNAGPNGWFTASIDTGNLEQPTGFVTAMPGETWYFQCWFRDGGSSNYTDTIAVTF